MARPDKAAAVAELTDKFRSSNAAVLTEYRGLTVKQLQDLRRSLGDNANYAVVKNTLAKLAANEAGIAGFDDLLVGPTAIAFINGDVVEAAKGLRDFAKANPTLVIKGGVLDGKPLDPNEIARLADLESREVLLGKLAGAMLASLSQAVYLLNAAIGAVGTRVNFAAESVFGKASPYADMVALTQAMAKGEIDVLVLGDVNPVFAMPAKAGFADALAKVPLVVSLASRPSETAARAHVVLPALSWLESWGDYAVAPTVVGLMQPAMGPVEIAGKPVEGKSAGEIIEVPIDGNRIFGAREVAILDGGLAKWLAEGRPLEDGEVVAKVNDVRDALGHLQAFGLGPIGAAVAAQIATRPGFRIVGAILRWETVSPVSPLP